MIEKTSAVEKLGFLGEEAGMNYGAFGMICINGCPSSFISHSVFAHPISSFWISILEFDAEILSQGKKMPQKEMNKSPNCGILQQ